MERPVRGIFQPVRAVVRLRRAGQSGDVFGDEPADGTPIEQQRSELASERFGHLNGLSAGTVSVSSGKVSPGCSKGIDRLLVIAAG
jgi:hypothetical protein